MATILQDDSRSARRRSAVAPGRGPRWTLSRAGIVNVYQYDNETLHFGGGRLLLRGVNGSGKSTAMSMLLPFLLDGDTRRIDAAGEQTGVLKAWMLTGREEPQPVGYLWLEVARGEEHLSFGCGLRASRAADQVSTWWFITSRRPGIDLQLLEGRVPVSREALRTQIAPDPLYGQEQRTDYRGELRRRLFGGADIEQHLHLLRIVRNPRIGDRLDTDLSLYLQDALPRLSEAALEDAAQPLEDLEEHKKNVEDLKRTAETLDALHATYCNYARAELHRFADQTGEAVRVFRDCHRQEEKAQSEHEHATQRQQAAEAGKRALEEEIEGLRATIAALHDSEAYKSGAQLNDQRAHVESLTRGAAAADEELRRWSRMSERAASAVREAQRDAETDQAALRRTVSNLSTFATGLRLSARPPVLPPLSPHPDSPRDLLLAPAGALEAGSAERALSALTEAARQRTDDVATVEEAVRRIEPAERAIREAEQAVSRARSEHDLASRALGDARVGFQTAVAAWQSAVAAWTVRLGAHHTAQGLGPVEPPAVVARVVDELLIGARITGELEALVAPAIEHHESQRAQREAALRQQREVVAQLAARAAELAAKQLPDPPLLGWQQRVGRCFAELVDFAKSLGPEARAGIEAALEASGILAAEVHGDGSLRLASGQLVIIPDTKETPAPLSALLRPDVPEDGAAPGMRQTVERILRGISTDRTSRAATVVTVEGEFRVGSVRGRLTKAEAEHIGVTARRAALQRQRAEIALLLEQARTEGARLAALLEDARTGLREAQDLRGQIPPERPLHTALWARSQAERVQEIAADQLRARIGEQELATARHAEAVTHAHDVATRLSLPADLTQLREIGKDLERVIADCAEARNQLALLARAVQRWRERGEEWRSAREEEARSQEHREIVRAELASAQARLAALDAAIGASYKQVVADLARQGDRLKEAQQSHVRQDRELQDAVKAVTASGLKREQAVLAREQADAGCVHKLGLLRRALTVPGLTDAATEVTAVPRDTPAGETRAAGRDALFPAVEDTVAGARALVEAIRAAVPGPQEPVTSAEGVRRSIRQRRDSLGAGWDAEDRQPDEQLPLHIEVTGPRTQEAPLPAAAHSVRGRLAEMSSLLSTKQQQALRNLLQGLVAREIAAKMHAAGELLARMNTRLGVIMTSHGIGVRLRWQRREDMDPALTYTMDVLAKPPDLRTAEEDQKLTGALGARIDEARREDPGTPYRELIARVLDYRQWHSMAILLLRPGRAPERLSRRTALSEGEKKMVTYLPLFAAVAASCDGLATSAPDALRFILLDDAFAKVSEDNHGKLFGLLVELDLDFIATSERLWGTHDTVPELAIAEVIRDAGQGTIVLEHSHWDGRRLELLR